MSFGIALSGINAAQSDLNVTANNVANSATNGFKQSRTEFAELFAVSPQGVSNQQAGAGCLTKYSVAVCAAPSESYTVIDVELL